MFSKAKVKKVEEVEVEQEQEVKVKVKEDLSKRAPKAGHKYISSDDGVSLLEVRE